MSHHFSSENENPSMPETDQQNRERINLGPFRRKKKTERERKGQGGAKGPQKLNSSGVKFRSGKKKRGVELSIRKTEGTQLEKNKYLVHKMCQNRDKGGDQRQVLQKEPGGGGGERFSG